MDHSRPPRSTGPKRPRPPGERRLIIIWKAERDDRRTEGGRGQSRRGQIVESRGLSGWRDGRGPSPLQPSLDERLLRRMRVRCGDHSQFCHRYTCYRRARSPPTSPPSVVPSSFGAFVVRRRPRPSGAPCVSPPAAFASPLIPSLFFLLLFLSVFSCLFRSFVLVTNDRALVVM